MTISGASVAFITVAVVVFVLLVVVLVWSLVDSTSGSSCSSCGGKNKSKPMVGVNVAAPSPPRTTLVIPCEKDNIGNQMFQIATGLEIAGRTGRRLVIAGPKLRRPMLTASKAARESLIIDDTLPKTTIGTGPATPGTAVVKEGPHFNFHAGLDLSQARDPSNEDVYLLGFFQCETYFKSVAQRVREIFAPSDETRDRLRKEMVAGAALKPYLIGVHVRRGDYLRLGHFHANQPLSYHIDGVKALSLEGREVRPVVFSDSKEAASRVVGALREAGFANAVSSRDVLSPGPPEMDIWGMASCDAVVATNSSFSWWGAWLSSAGSPVAFPSRWFDLRADHTEWSDAYKMADHPVSVVPVSDAPLSVDVIVGAEHLPGGAKDPRVPKDAPRRSAKSYEEAVSYGLRILYVPKPPEGKRWAWRTSPSTAAAQLEEIQARHDHPAEVSIAALNHAHVALTRKGDAGPTIMWDKLEPKTLATPTALLEALDV